MLAIQYIGTIGVILLKDDSEKQYRLSHSDMNDNYL